MTYQEWLTTVPEEITHDPLWRLEVYRLGLFVAEIGWEDVVLLDKNKLTRDAADQIMRSLDSICANIAEGFSRSTGKDRARYFEYALGEAREVIRSEDEATVRRWQFFRFDPETDLEHTIDRYEILKDGNVIASEEHHQSPATRSYTQGRAIALYQEAGFEDIQVFHEFTFESVKPEDQLFCVLGFKPK